jgi:hypothetical protein
MPCSFGLLSHRRSEGGVQPSGLLRVTVTDRWIPLVPARYGTWVARPARTTSSHVTTTAPARPEGEARASVTTASWARARRARGNRWGDSSSALLSTLLPAPGPILSFTSGSRTRRDRWCPLRSLGRRSGVYARVPPPALVCPVADASGAPVLPRPRAGAAGRVRQGLPSLWTTT